MNRLFEKFREICASYGDACHRQQLWESCAIGRTDYVTSILSNNDIDPDICLRPGGLSPLAFSVAQGQVEVARVLLAHGANPDFVADGGVTPRMIAEKIADPDMTNVFAQHDARRPKAAPRKFSL